MITDPQKNYLSLFNPENFKEKHKKRTKDFIEGLNNANTNAYCMNLDQPYLQKKAGNNKSIFHTLIVYKCLKFLNPNCTEDPDSQINQIFMSMRFFNAYLKPDNYADPVFYFTENFSVHFFLKHQN